MRTYRERVVRQVWEPKQFAAAVRRQLEEEERNDQELQDMRLQACLDRILQYSLSKRDGRLSRDTFPGLMTMHDYGPLRIAVLGRPGVGRSHTANNILELLGEDPTEGVYSAGEGSCRVRDAPIYNAAGHSPAIMLRTSRGSGETWGRDSAICMMEAVLSNKLHAGDECYMEYIRHNDSSPMANQCHAAMFFTCLHHLSENVRPGDLTEQMFWSRFRPLFSRLDITPVTLVTKMRCLHRDELCDGWKCVTHATQFLGSAENQVFPIENKEPTGDPEAVRKRLRQELVLALLEVMYQAEYRVHRHELRALRYTSTGYNATDIRAKYAVAALVHHTARKYAWPSHRLAALETALRDQWLTAGNAEDEDHLTPEQFVSMMSDEAACRKVFRSDGQMKQVSVELAAMRPAWRV
ncbi:uncharacterized protein LOC135812011 [Sycon ciliatum]|uniref:uncharacterized protein LOC135812011 n=1 Tax=Sycon ciliatum TaxID=27933 RepID=UPI0031F614E9